MFKDLEDFFKEYGDLIKEHFIELFRGVYAFLKRKWLDILIAVGIFVIGYKLTSFNDNTYLFRTSIEKIPDSLLDHINGHVIIIYVATWIILSFLLPIFSDYVDNLKNHKKSYLKTLRRGLGIYLACPFYILIIWILLNPIILYVNTLIVNQNCTEVLEVFAIYDDKINFSHKEFGRLHHEFDLNAIEEYRVSNGLSSIYTLKEGDTIMLKFSKGFLDDLYLK